ncbi:RagB/SusD family nutrient uptake outer membrane protein [Pedobacter hiemivivus]|uniref:RagB/SusD family nutrient uptake outer membrane protein n=1 Tax=Pedobacter hiemivivus TaxID=2530454 RepID=A0A4U1GR30_9SPHI|nr:RagB/SusD family nutrient uptake outer membrane protein [Pedobacter hiemivivus]TKC65660.1 RagB/SusD family nutrient uptake outer membrane protein [Pedobacter hiemivivus]
MNKIFFSISIFSLCLLSILNTGCKKLIEIPDNAPGQIVTSQVFIDSASAVNSVVGIYASNFFFSGPLNGAITINNSMSADELATNESYYLPIYNNALNPGDATLAEGTVGSLWSASYGKTAIYQANACIEGLTASATLSNSLKDQLIGECKVFRALSYFHLVNLFGAVPLALTTDYRVNNKLPRASVEEVYVQIKKDLLEASAELKSGYPSPGKARPNKYTALALLSRIYLYHQEWDKAEEIATNVITLGGYQLVQNPNDVFLTGSNEAIWQIAPMGFFPYMSTEGSTLIPYANNIIPTYYINPYLLNAFEAGDRRKTSWLNTSTPPGGPTYYYPYKYKNTYGVQTNGNSETYVMFRLAEQYLIRAEARAKQNNYNGAVEDLNILRQRARAAATPQVPNPLPDLPLDLSPTATISAIAHERQIELFCEWGHRWYDLKRTGTINAVLGAEKPGIWPADGHAALYPVPQNQIQANPGWIQNPGYNQ